MKDVMWELKSVFFGGFEMFKGIKLVVQSVKNKNKTHLEPSEARGFCLYLW